MVRRESSDFATQLRQYRLAAGLTQEGLAERAHLSARAISDLERGVKRAPRRDTVALLIAALALSPREQIAFRALARGSPATVDVTQGFALASEPGVEPAPHATAIPLIGRAEEMALVERLLTGQGPPCLLLAGEPGIGKSRLLREAAGRAAESGFRVLTGGCTQRYAQESFAPVIEAIERDIQARELVELRDLLAGCAWLVRLLPELADAPIEALPALPLTPSQERRLVFRAIQRVLRNAAGPSGVLLTLDDLQWAGADGLELLVDLLRRAGEIPLRVIGAYRDTELAMSPALSSALADLGQAGLLERRRLTSMPDEDAAALLAATLRDPHDASATDRADILRRAEGVPFYLVSLAELVHDAVPDSVLPWTVAQSVQQRVQVLPEPSQAILSAAAVLGREVDPSLLCAMTRKSEDTVLDTLDAACQTRLMVDGGDGTYRFAHDLIREVLEANLSTARRALLHQRIAVAIEQAWQDKRASAELPVERLAYHYQQAGDDGRAMAYMSQAAARARRVAAHRDEVRFLDDALALAARNGHARVIADLRARRGMAFFDLGQWGAAREDLEDAAADLAGEPDEQLARVLVALAMVCHWLLDVESTRRYATSALRLAEQLDRRDLVAEAMSALAFADSSDGDLFSSLNQYRRAFAVAGTRQNPRLVPAGEMSTLIYYWLGQYQQAVAVGQDTLHLARDVGDTAYTARVLGNLGLALTGAGRYGEALATFAEARQFCREHGLRQWLARATSMEGSLYGALFDVTRAEELAAEAREEARSLHWPLGAVSAAIDLLLSLARRGEAGERAERLLQEAAETANAAKGAHGWLWQLRLCQARAELALAREAWEAARGLADESIALAQRRGRVKYEVFGRTTRAAALLWLDQDEDALLDLDFAVTLARSCGDPALLLHAIAARLTLGNDDALFKEAELAGAHIVTAMPSEELRARFKAEVPIPGLFAATS